MLSLRPSTVLMMLLPAAILVVAALLIPVGFLLSASFYAADGIANGVGSIGLANYVNLITDKYTINIVLKTIWLSFLVAVICLVIGFPAAVMIVRAGKRWKMVLTIVVLSPLLVSVVVSSYGWVVLLGNRGVLNGMLVGLGLIGGPATFLYTDLSLVVGLVHVLLPFMVLSLVAALEKVDPVLAEAAATLGAARYRIWWHVLLPLALPGIGSGTTIVFALAMSSYVTPAVLGPSGPNFVTTMIYQYFVTLYDWATGSALAVLLLIVSMSAIASFGAVMSSVTFSEPDRT